MSICDVMIDAVEQVLFWEIPDRDVGRVASYQAALMAKVHPEWIYSNHLDQMEL
ncbi:hypothetical protein GTP41_20075 [Pseudoduganella sp. DS3]|uniref:Uncharacterized protein n=1 Tax=Pseudoduganella guangdongensis TaxID=2692179 RepID=A0A6N9HLB4_9BURK|nr:hypothetical protein [Pseudoduganella guangdongensis]MYN04394.1 hypothetical protein [Pseudoduganella guangdongensis]